MPRFDKLLVLDLDETLVYATDEFAELPEPSDDDFIVGPYLVRPRPGASAFLARCLEWFEVGVWTASTRDYARPVLHRLVELERLSFLWGRERCTWRTDMETREGYWIKDIKKLRRRGYARSRIIVVDDTPRKLERSYGNLVRARAFFGALDDRHLGELLPYLESLGELADVRRVEKRGWSNAPSG
ncbi:MAG: HAD family hydrolase [Myxococcales bacterium]|nr:HAD family hydrolase [Myxococcales bacterium]MCB9752238.1 HAD family hydrolase [Myxococcales bacterium]